MAKKKLTNRNGYWSKRVNGTTHYFGKDYSKAVIEWKKQEPFLRAGIDVPSEVTGATLADLLNEFLNDRLQRVELELMGQDCRLDDRFFKPLVVGRKPK